jgi:hypothetical protein
MREDLDDLQYLPPEGMKSSHTLAIRIINLDSEDRATLAVLDFPVSPAPAARPSLPGAADAETDLELRRLKDDHTKTKDALRAREQELSDARQALEQARSETLHEGDRLGAARAAWQSELDARLAQAHGESTKKIEASRATWLSELNTRIEESRARWQREAELALTHAKEAWKAEEAARLSQAETQWREQFAHGLAEAKAETRRTEAALSRAEAETARMSSDGAALRSLREALAAANASLTARTRDLTEARKHLDEARADGLKGKSELAAARVAWQSELDRRVAEARAEVFANRDTPDLEDRVQLRIEQARTQWKRDAEALVAAAQEAWTSDEAVRLARSEGRWREQSAAALANATARAEKAEKALARAQERAAPETTDAVELRRVREELAETRTVLADRETKLSQVRSDTKRARERWKAEAEIALKNAQEAWRAEEAYRVSVARGDWQRDLRVARDSEAIVEQGQARNIRRLVLDGLLAASLAVCVVVSYPSIAPLLIRFWPGAQPSATAAVQTGLPQRRPPVPPAPPAHFDVTVRGANVHADPSATGAIVTSLARGVKVETFEQRGNWVRVRIANGAQLQLGWVYGPYLKDSSGS